MVMREMETARLYLRSWKLTDSSSLFKYASDPEVGPRVGWSPHTSIDESEKIIQSVLLNKNNYAICKKEENCIIGSIGFDECETVKGKTEATIGYWISRPFWGLGFGPEALEQIVWYCFEEKKFESLWCEIFEDNHRSIKIVERLEFELIYTKPSVYVEAIDLSKNLLCYRLKKSQKEGMN